MKLISAKRATYWSLIYLFPKITKRIFHYFNGEEKYVFPNFPALNSHVVFIFCQNFIKNHNRLYCQWQSHNVPSVIGFSTTNSSIKHILFFPSRFFILLCPKHNNVKRLLQKKLWKKLFQLKLLIASIVVFTMKYKMKNFSLQLVLCRDF